MSTTTVRLEEELRSRIHAAAGRLGESPHAYIVGAIERSVAASEAEVEFEQLASARWLKLLRSGKAVGWDDTKAWLQACVDGKRPKRPVARLPGTRSPRSPG